MPKVGIWIIGASGSVSATSIAGAFAIAARQTPPTGMVTELPQFKHIKFPAISDMVFGGHEIRRPALLAEIRGLQKSGVPFTPEIMDLATDKFPEVEANIKPGTAVACGKVVERLSDIKLISEKVPAKIIDKIRKDLEDFKSKTRCKHLVVINLQSTEPIFDPLPAHKSLSALRKALKSSGKPVLPASSLYAMAALEAGAAFVNFTPSLGPDIPALHELAQKSGIICGSDGKTGETLLKSVLAPLFAMRNLQILSWVGHNILGNRDGLVLDDPKNKATKVKSKDHLIKSIVGYSPKTLVSIENIPDIGDWKVAWDHIHFAGFLGTRMKLQCTWEGCDSLLAAPLVLDLARLAAYSLERGEHGVMTHTASFFKSPIGVEEQDMFKQFQMLEKYCKKGRK